MTDIMLVDDEVLALEYLKNMVDWERNGYHVVGCATSGKKALELFDRTHPQIVISDIRMPGTDGLELTRQIKEKDKETVVILLSAYRDFDYAQEREFATAYPIIFLKTRAFFGTDSKRVGRSERKAGESRQ